MSSLKGIYRKVRGFVCKCVVLHLLCYLTNIFPVVETIDTMLEISCSSNLRDGPIFQGGIGPFFVIDFFFFCRLKALYEFSLTSLHDFSLRPFAVHDFFISFFCPPLPSKCLSYLSP